MDTGDPASAVALFDAAVTDGTLDATFFFTTAVGYLQLDDLPLPAGAAMALLSVARPDDARDRHVAANAQPAYLAAAGDSDAAVDWANQAMAIVSEAGSSSAVAYALHVRSIAYAGNPWPWRTR